MDPFYRASNLASCKGGGRAVTGSTGRDANFVALAFLIGLGTAKVQYEALKSRFDVVSS